MSTRTFRRTSSAAAPVALAVLGAALLLPAGAASAQAVEACVGSTCVEGERSGKGDGRPPALVATTGDDDADDAADDADDAADDARERARRAPEPVRTTTPPARTTTARTAPAPVRTTRRPAAPPPARTTTVTRAPAPVRSTTAADTREQSVAAEAEQRRAPVSTAGAGVEGTDAAVEQTDDGVPPVDARRAPVGLPSASPSPAATSPSPSPGPSSGGTAQPDEDRTARAVSSVQDLVPGRSTGLLLALATGVLALLLLVAREWSR